LRSISVRLIIEEIYTVRRLISMLPLLLAACATTNPGGSISVETRAQGQPLAGANCVVRTGAGNWNVVTPGTVFIGNPIGDLHVVCDKPGYRTSELVYRPSSGYSGSGVGVGLGGGSGNVGVGLGLNVPLMLGGGGYPARIIVDMNPQ
jgi:hypothetical protein